MREILLRKLEAAIDDCAKNDKPLPTPIKYLAGLQQIRYIFVYPEQKDIVLVGPGEGWKIDAKGNVVGITTGRPVMLWTTCWWRCVRPGPRRRAASLARSIPPPKASRV